MSGETLTLISFRLRGSIAHFRMPDTSITHSSYPFPPKPTLLGLIGAIIGVDNQSPSWRKFLMDRHFLGIAFQSPLKKTCTVLSLLGKDFLSSGEDFNRPTSVELIVQPTYQIFYSGPVSDELLDFITARRSIYHTYLGSAFCLVFPEEPQKLQGEVMEIDLTQEYSVESVLPVPLLAKITPLSGSAYATARAVPLVHNGDRTFHNRVDFIFEASGKPILAKLKKSNLEHKIVRLQNNQIICLW